MIRRFIFTAFLLFSCFVTATQLHAATIKDAEARIQTIETYKLILASGNSSYVFTPEEIATINAMYAELENDVYTISTRDGSLKMDIGEYNIDRTMWPVKLSGSYFEKHVTINRDIPLLYSTLMERRYVAEKDMADYQRRDYEYYVTEYESKIRSGEDVFYAEIHFKIQRWNKPSQYRFMPEDLVLYKIAKQDRIIDTANDLTPVIWSYKPEIEYRTKKEIESDIQKTKRILYAESRQSSKDNEPEPETEEDEYKGRRAIYFSLETFKDKSDDPNSPSISTIKLNSFDAALTFGIGNYAFAGLELCFDLNEQKKHTVYSFGGLLGGNIEVFNFFRPYIQTGFAVRTDDRFIFKAGLGLDIKIGHLLITGSFNHVWNNAFSSDKANSMDREDKAYNAFSTGIGITW